MVGGEVAELLPACRSTSPRTMVGASAGLSDEIMVRTSDLIWLACWYRRCGSFSRVPWRQSPNLQRWDQSGATIGLLLVAQLCVVQTRILYPLVGHSHGVVPAECVCLRLAATQSTISPEKVDLKRQEHQARNLEQRIEVCAGTIQDFIAFATSRSPPTAVASCKWHCDLSRSSARSRRRKRVP